jgi:hypothetical protein
MIKNATAKVAPKQDPVPADLPTTNKPPRVYMVGKKQLPEGDLRIRLRAHIMAGGAPKYFSLGEGRCPTNAGKMLNAMGIKKVYITEDEQDLLMKLRKERAK